MSVKTDVTHKLKNQVSIKENAGNRPFASAQETADAEAELMKLREHEH